MMVPGSPPNEPESRMWFCRIGLYVKLPFADIFGVLWSVLPQFDTRYFLLFSFAFLASAIF
jgi:hypothetical protein